MGKIDKVALSICAALVSYYIFDMIGCPNVVLPAIAGAAYYCMLPD